MAKPPAIVAWEMAGPVSMDLSWIFIRLKAQVANPPNQSSGWIFTTRAIRILGLRKMMKFINLGLALVLASCGSIGSYNNGDSAIESSAVGINYLSGHKSMVGQLSVEECGAYKSGYCFLVFGEKYYLPFDCA